MNLKLNIEIPEAALSGIREIVGASTDNFLELVKAAKLSKRTDFVGMSFDDMNLDGLELNAFDFSDADFRRCSLKGTVFIECQLKGAAFSFPPEVRDKWQRRPNFFVGEENSQALELMRIAEEATRKEERKDALNELLKIEEENVKSFLQNIALKDKAKSLRHWLRARLTGGFKQKDELKFLLERSLFESGQDLNDDIDSYFQLMGTSDEGIETLCQICATNSRAIKGASRVIGEKSPFTRLLIKNLSHADDRQIWAESATALRDIQISQREKDVAFNMRLQRVKDRYDASYLAMTAALNNVRNSKIFEMCERGYRETADAWHADDFLLYCYFYDKEKYRNDVLFYSFSQVETTHESIPAGMAFGAYCFVEAPELYRAIQDEADHFYIDPLTLIGVREDYYREDRFSPTTREGLRKLSVLGHEQAQNVRIEDLIRRATKKGGL